MASQQFNPDDYQEKINKLIAGMSKPGVKIVLGLYEFLVKRGSIENLSIDEAPPRLKEWLDEQARMVIDKDEDLSDEEKAWLKSQQVVARIAGDRLLEISTSGLAMVALKKSWELYKNDPRAPTMFNEAMKATAADMEEEEKKYKANLNQKDDNDDIWS